MTSLVFGYKEVIGHMIIHTVLILFLIEGTGNCVPLFSSTARPLNADCLWALTSACFCSV